MKEYLDIQVSQFGLNEHTVRHRGKNKVWVLTSLSAGFRWYKQAESVERAVSIKEEGWKRLLATHVVAQDMSAPCMLNCWRPVRDVCQVHLCDLLTLHVMSPAQLVPGYKYNFSQPNSDVKGFADDQTDLSFGVYKLCSVPIYRDKLNKQTEPTLQLQNRSPGCRWKQMRWCGFNRSSKFGSWETRTFYSLCASMKEME